jgi:hypothetical protein
MFAFSALINLAYSASLDDVEKAHRDVVRIRQRPRHEGQGEGEGAVTASPRLKAEK